MGSSFLGLNGNLMDQLCFYGAYHSKPLNQLIHFVFVPAILWSVTIWLAYTPRLLVWHAVSALPAAAAPVAPHLHLNGSFVLLAFYSLYYLALEPAAGLSWAACVALPMWASANAFCAAVPHAWAWALGVHILGWFMQIVPGHSWVEQRRPALLDSFFQSLVLAPLFVWFELLFLLGYRPELHQQVQDRIRANIAEFRKGAAQQHTVGEGKKEG